MHTQRSKKIIYKPYWSDELENTHKDLSDARKTAETSPSIENSIALKHASAKFNKTRNEARTKSWMKKNVDLDMEKDDTKLWRLTRQLNNDGTRQSKIKLLQGDSIVYVKQAADILACSYKEASDISQYCHTNKQKFAENNETSKYQMIYLISWIQQYRWKS